MISHPKPPFFVRLAGFGSKTAFFGVFFSSVREIFSPEISFCTEKISLTGCFSDQSTRNSTFAGKEKEKAGVFLPLPHSVQKIQADFLSKCPHFSRLPPLFLSKPPYPTQIPIQSYAQDTRLRVYTRLRTQRICLFCFHPSPRPATSCRSIGWVWRQTLPSPSPQQPEKQHIARLPLQKNRWRQKGEAFTRNTHVLNTLSPKGEEVKAKIEKHWTRARVGNNKEKALFLWTEQVATIISAALKAYPVGAAVHEKSDIKSVDLINPCYICLILSQ